MPIYVAALIASGLRLFLPRGLLTSKPTEKWLDRLAEGQLALHLTAAEFPTGDFA